LIDDPTIDIVYVPLPNGLWVQQNLMDVSVTVTNFLISRHYEWALKSLKAGKHVLIEKPSTSNAIEAESLFGHELLKQPNAPILLDACHVQFHPAWQTYLAQLDRPNLASGHASVHLPPIWPYDDIRWIYDLAGGTLLDLGTYPVLYLRQMMGAEPLECVEAVPRLLPEGYDPKCDVAFDVKWHFPNNSVGTLGVAFDHKGGYPFPWLTKNWWAFSMPKCVAVHRETAVKNDALPLSQEEVVEKTVTMLNMMAPHIWHRIDISEKHIIRNKEDKTIVETWTTISSKKAYTWAEGGFPDRRDDYFWGTYRCQLEEFVNKIRGRKGSGVWMDGTASINQIKMIDSAYEKSGLGTRPLSAYARIELGVNESH